MTYKDDFDYDRDFERPASIPQSGRGSGFWVHAWHLGKLIVFGPFQTDDEGSAYGFRKLGSDFSCTWLPTKDMHRATAMLKKKLFDSGHQLEEALRRAQHTEKGLR